VSDAVSPVSLVRIRLAVGPFLGLAVFPDRTLPLAYAGDNASRRVQPPSRVLTVRPSRADDAAGSSPELSLPTAHQGSEVHLTRALPARYVPPSGFGYPLDGLLPPSPCRPFFVPTALMGFPLRSVPLPESRTASPPHSHPPAVSSDAAPGAKHQAGTPDRGSWALSFPRVPGDRGGFSASPAGYSLGVCPFQGSPAKT
jgi:hypothetical protein